MPVPWTALLVGSNLLLVADKVPQFDTAPSCRAAAVASTGPNRNAESCQKDEDTARQTLEKDWANFAASDRERCGRLIRLGGSPSYVELLTCVEMAKAAAALPKENLLNSRPGR